LATRQSFNSGSFEVRELALPHGIDNKGDNDA
jgi:hypothetical protein